VASILAGLPAGLRAEPTHTGAGSLRPTTLPQVKIPTFLYNVTSYPTLKAEPTHTGAGSLRPTTLPQVKIPTFPNKMTHSETPDTNI
jgi:hypothetical protein